MTSSLECCTAVVKQMDIKSLSECCKEAMDIKSLRGCGKVLLNSSFYSLDQVGTVSVFLQRAIQQGRITQVPLNSNDKDNNLTTKNKHTNEHCKND